MRQSVTDETFQDLGQDSGHLSSLEHPCCPEKCPGSQNTDIFSDMRVRFETAVYKAFKKLGHDFGQRCEHVRPSMSTIFRAPIYLTDRPTDGLR